MDLNYFAVGCSWGNVGDHAALGTRPRDVILGFEGDVPDHRCENLATSFLTLFTWYTQPFFFTKYL